MRKKRREEVDTRSVANGIVVVFWADEEDSPHRPGQFGERGGARAGLRLGIGDRQWVDSWIDKRGEVSL